MTRLQHLRLAAIEEDAALEAIDLQIEIDYNTMITVSTYCGDYDHLADCPECGREKEFYVPEHENETEIDLSHYEDEILEAITSTYFNDKLRTEEWDLYSTMRRSPVATGGVN
jgi:hypothetical protein